MTHTFEKSSALRSCAHNEQDNELTITFNSGTTHIFCDCPKSVFDGLKEAKSPGGYFHSTIRGKFKEKAK